MPSDGDKSESSECSKISDLSMKSDENKVRLVCDLTVAKARLVIRRCGVCK